MSYDFSFIIATPRPEAFPFYLYPKFPGKVEHLRDPRAEPLEPELLIVDNQTAMLYDAASYQNYIDESYARKRGA